MKQNTTTTNAATANNASALYTIPENLRINQGIFTESPIYQNALAWAHFDLAEKDTAAKLEATRRKIHALVVKSEHSELDKAESLDLESLRAKEQMLENAQVSAHAGRDDLYHYAQELSATVVTGEGNSASTVETILRLLCTVRETTLRKYALAGCLEQPTLEAIYLAMGRLVNPDGGFNPDGTMRKADNGEAVASIRKTAKNEIEKALQSFNLPKSTEANSVFRVRFNGEEFGHLVECYTTGMKADVSKTTKDKVDTYTITGTVTMSTRIQQKVNRKTGAVTYDGSKFEAVLAETLLAQLGKKVKTAEKQPAPIQALEAVKTQKAAQDALTEAKAEKSAEN